MITRITQPAMFGKSLQSASEHEYNDNEEIGRVGAANSPPLQLQKHADDAQLCFTFYNATLRDKGLVS